MTEYWTMFWFSGYQRCSAHRTLAAALRAARKCERDGGTRHDIVKVERIPRKDRPIR